VTTDFQLGNRCLVAKDYARAIEHFVRHAASVPAEAAKAYAAAGECCLRTNILPAPVPVAKGVQLVSQGNLRGAEHFFRLALAADPDNVRALWGLAELLPGASNERLALLERCIAVAPGTLNLIATGDFHRSHRKDFPRAYEYYRQAQAHDPLDGTAYKRLNDICRRMGNKDEAAAWSERWREAYAGKPRVDRRE